MISAGANAVQQVTTQKTSIYYRNFISPYFIGNRRKSDLELDIELEVDEMTEG